MAFIATLEGPDVDDLVAVWLVFWYCFNGKARIKFIHENSTGLLRWPYDSFVCVGDVHDPESLRFNHKAWTLRDRRLTHTSPLVWEWLLDRGHPVAHLVDLIDAVQQGDRVLAKPEVPETKLKLQGGPHTIYKRIRAEVAGSAHIFDEMANWLSRLAKDLRNTHAVDLDWYKAISQLPRSRASFALILKSPGAGAIRMGRGGHPERMVIHPGYYLYTGGSNGHLTLLKQHLTPLGLLDRKSPLDTLRLLATVTEVWYTANGRSGKVTCHLAECAKQTSRSHQLGQERS